MAVKKFKNIKSAEYYKKGDIVRMLTDTYISYGLKKGDTTEVVSIYNPNVQIMCMTGPINVPVNMIEPATITRAEFEKEIAELNKEIEQKQMVLNWMDESGADAYDPNEFKAFQMLQAIKTESSDMEKAKIIAQLIRNGL